MNIEPSISSITETFLSYKIAAATRGTGIISASSAVLDLPDIISVDYQTVLTVQYTIENSGFTEILDLFVDLIWNVKGNGSTRWQISGDGGTTFVTITEVAFNEIAFAERERLGAGSWITSVDAGNNKLILRLQAKANAGTVSTQINDLSLMEIQYRKTAHP